MVGHKYGVFKSPELNCSIFRICGTTTKIWEFFLKSSENPQISFPISMSRNVVDADKQTYSE